MNYYLVKCKFGHVGRNKYLPLEIPITATSMKEASSIARKIRGVKKNHKDWCLELPREVEQKVYYEALEMLNKDIYFEKHSRSRNELFAERLIDEPNYTNYRDKKTNKQTYIKTRNKEVVHFKQNKQKILDRLSLEYVNNVSWKNISVGW